jgi:inhibitor of KinA sporulation pathway (predicted exonuclease)
MWALIVNVCYYRNESFMNFIALDLELNNAEDNSTPDPPIIQVGISVGNRDSGILLTKYWILNPEEPIYEFIEKLTGINDMQITREFVSMQKMSEELSEIIKKYDCFVNPVTWGVGDAQKLIKELKKNNIYFPFFGRRELDVKQIYAFLMLSDNKKPNSSLKSALSKFRMKFNGEPHRAHYDAENTLLLFFKLMDRQNNLHNNKL